MRITNSIIQQTSLSNLQKNLRELYRAQEQVTSGRKFQKASDDPIGASTSMETRSSIRALSQYRKGVQTATARATREETVLDQVTDILTRAKELAIAYGNDTVSPDQRKVAGVEIEELMRQAVALGNTRHGDGYLFGGTGASAQPYDVTETPAGLDFTTTSPSGTVQIAVSPNHSVPANHSGVEVFEDSRLLTSLRDLAVAFRSGRRDDIVDTIGDIDTAFQNVQHLLGEVGSRASSLQVTDANLNALEVGLEVLKSDVEDVEIEEAITELMSRQTSYQAALMTTSRVIGMTLADYLR